MDSAFTAQNSPLGYNNQSFTDVQVKDALFSEIHTKHIIQCEHHVEFLNIMGVCKVTARF